VGALASTVLLTMELFVCLCVGLAGSSGRNCIFSPQGGGSSVMGVSSGCFRAVAFVGSLINFLQIWSPKGFH